MQVSVFYILLSFTLATSYPVFPLFSVDNPSECNYDQFMDVKFCDESDTITISVGSSYAITDCVAYVTPYEDLTSHLCPFIIPAMTESDIKCHKFYYSNSSVVTLNFQIPTPPTQFSDTTGVIISPFLNSFVSIYCPLYGYPPLTYNWRVPINGVYTSGLNVSSLEALKKIRYYKDRYALSSLFIEESCLTAVSIVYASQFDGNFSCIGTNNLGSKTVSVTSVTNRSICVTRDNLEFTNSSNRQFSLASDYKVSPAQIGTDITVNCTFSPISADISLFWVKTENLRNVNNFCVNKSNPHILASNNKYTIKLVLVLSGPQDKVGCSRLLSLTIHEFKREDEGNYSCTTVLCSGPYSDISSRRILVAGDRDTQTPSTWLFALVTPPLLLIAVSLAVSSVLVYVYKVRLIRWYISWRVEEPTGQFEYDLCICTAEEYKQRFVDQVNSSLFDLFEDEKVLWSEKDSSILAGRSHFVNASEILEKCRKFIFVVDERFVDCFFCKQLMEMAVEKSSVKNWNIILPVKWNQQAVVPDELLVYRYVEKEGNEHFEREVGNFMDGRNVTRRNERNIYGTEMDILSMPLV